MWCRDAREREELSNGGCGAGADRSGVVSPLVVVILLVVLVPAAFGGGYLMGVRRPARPSQTAPAPDAPRKLARAPAARLANLVTRTGAALANVAVRTGVDIGNRAIRDSLETLSAWALRERPDLRQVTAKDGTVTLMFSDIEGSTAISERLGDDAWLEVLTAHDTVVRRSVRSDDGQVIKTQGDSFMVAFAHPEKAVSCAIAIQSRVQALEVRDDVALRVRIGLHTGAAIARGRDLFGINVATASRVAAEARGGEILVTEEVAARLGSNAELGRPRKVTLRGLSHAQRVMSVRWNDEDDTPSAARIRLRRALRRDR
jgi:class 3 adenylate cyclase